ncbi:MAG: ABC transporter ATP-binding protein [Bacteroidetes bacterium]|nr:ABC transporter ATP-binding protein [Bacteroidota bacterium]
MQNAAIRISNLSKSYFIGEKISSDATLVSAFGRWLKRVSTSEKKKLIWALKDVSLEIKEGSITGIIGRNGAGKSTLLKILSRVTEPSTGRIEMHGRVAGLLEVGTGFHPELTGRENIYLNATLLGMRKHEVDKKLEEIIAFSGVEEFIDTPIKKYSSGMKVRLAFSVAAYLEPEILIVDEVLAVGDAAFQQKSMGKINDVAKSGRTVLLVSHNMASIRSLCTETIFLEEGRVKMQGETNEVVRTYLQENISDKPHLFGEELTVKTERHLEEKTPSVFLNHVRICDANFNNRNEFYSDEEILIEVGCKFTSAIKDLRIVVTISDEENNAVLISQTSDSEGFVTANNHVAAGEYISRCSIPANSFGNSYFYVSVDVINPYSDHLILTRALSFKVIFKGYNNIQLGSFGEAYMRPQLGWEFIENKG